MADEENATEGVEEQSGGKGKMMIIGGIAVVMLVVGVFAGPAIMNMISPPEPDAEEQAQLAKGPPIYQSLHPPLIINFKDSLGDAHYMQVTMEVMSRDQGVINLLREHTPAIRNALILLFSSAVYDEVTTREGKEALLAQGLAEIKRVMNEVTGKEVEGIEAAYFSALVIQ